MTDVNDSVVEDWPVAVLPGRRFGYARGSFRWAESLVTAGVDSSQDSAVDRHLDLKESATNDWARAVGAILWALSTAQTANKVSVMKTAHCRSGIIALPRIVKRSRECIVSALPSLCSSDGYPRQWSHQPVL